MFSKSLPVPWAPAPLLFAAKVEDLRVEIEALRPPWKRSPAGLPHSVSSPNRSHYPQLCCNQRYQAEHWTKAMTDGCFSAFCRRRTVFNSWMHDKQTQKIGNSEIFMSCEQFQPLQDVDSAEKQWVSVYLNCCQYQQQTLAIPTQDCCITKGNHSKKYFTRFMRLCLPVFILL